MAAPSRSVRAALWVLVGPTGRILIGLAGGVVVGVTAPTVGAAMKPIADAFLRLIKMVVAPLVFSTLTVGIAGAGDFKAMGRIGLKALAYFEAATTAALALGLLLVNVLRPGSGAPALGGGGAAVAAAASAPPSVPDLLLHLVPSSIVDAMARGDVLQIVVFSTLFGAALASLGAAGRPVVDVLEATMHVMFRVTGYVMALAPIGVCAAVAAALGTGGVGLLASLGRLIAVMYLGLALFAGLVLAAVSRLVRVPFGSFAAAVRQPFLIAFATASSEAALPAALDAMERFGVPRNIASFVLPTGYSFNLDGTTLYLSVASVFVAQLAGVHMTAGQQLMMMLTLMLTSKGVAGVPRAALVVLTAALGQFGLPLEGAAVLLGVDQILDMGRTAVNVMGNCLASAVVARWEGVFDDERMLAFRGAEAVGRGARIARRGSEAGA